MKKFIDSNIKFKKQSITDRLQLYLFKEKTKD